MDWCAGVVRHGVRRVRRRLAADLGGRIKNDQRAEGSQRAGNLLYRQVDRDDNAPDEIIYARIKILTEEGRKYGDVEIPYNKSTESVRGIQARTIRPDGSVVNFEGTMFEKPLVRGRGIKLLAKTFTLPEVQVGSIIEYRYRHQFQRGYVSTRIGF